MRRVRFVIAALLTVLGIAPLGAQEPAGTIRGRVVDEASLQPLARVTVAVGSRGAISQPDGSYILTGIPAGAAAMRVRMLGYAPVTRTVLVTGGATVVADIAMTAQAVSLSEIVVTGYGEQSAGDITGAVSQITPDEFNPGRITSPEQLLQSKVAGVQVVDNNEPGGGMTVRIRGATSINASSDPLYVIDGMPVGSGGLSAGRNPLNFLNPNDIESMTVLRDASAASIYGANAANGVVLITTKSGTGRRGTQIDYSSSASASSVTKLPDMLNATQFRAAVTQYAPTNVSQLRSASTDWFSLIDRTAYGQEQNLSVTSASEGMFYRMSLGYLNQDGIIQGTTTERLSLGVNYQQHLFDNHLDLRANFKGSRTNDLFTPGGVLSNAAQMGPTQPAYDSTSVTGYYDWPGNQLQSADNPLAILRLASDHGTTWRSLGNLQADYRFPFLTALRANVNVGYDVAKADRSIFTPGTLHSQLKTGTGGTLYRRNDTQLNSLLDVYLNYSAPLNVLPGNIDATAGYAYSLSHAEYPWFLAQGLSTDLLGDNGIPAARTVQNSLWVVDSKLISFFGRANYNIADRYLISLSVRRDGSSRFGPNNAWGTFPSAAVAWRVSQESFMRGFASLSDFKLRASWAKTGNQAFADYQAYPSYTYGDAQTQYQFGNQFITTIRPSAVDPNIKWEETRSYNLGIDFGFANQRFSGTIDWYTKNTSDLIFNVPVAAGTNFSNYLTTNIGSMKNSGLEFGLNARLLEGRGGDLGWTASFTASRNTNELTSINPAAGSAAQILVGGVAGGVGTTIQVLMPGQPINSFFVYQQLYDATGKPVQGSYVDQPTVLDTIRCPTNPVCTGLYRPDSVINGNDRRPYHDPAPKWILGHTSYVTYHNWDFSFTLRAYLGSYVYNNVASNLGTYSEVTRGSPYNLHASVLETGFTSPQYQSDLYVEKASFLRMDNITVGYTLHSRGQPWRLYATVQNVFTSTGYTGVDPTAGLNGIDNNIYPRSRTFTGGLSVRF